MLKRDFVTKSLALIASTSALPLTSWAQSGKVVRFGQSASLSGGQAAYGADVRDGILAAFAAASRTGPYKLELVTLDDGGKADKCKANTAALIAQGVSGLVGYTSGAASEQVMGLVDEAGIAFLGAASGNMGIRQPKSVHAFHVRAGYDDEYLRMTRYLKEFGYKRIATVRLADTSPANQTAMTNALEKTGLKIELTVSLDRNNKTFDAPVAQLLKAKPDCIVFTTNASPIAGMVDGLKAGNYHGDIFSSSFAGQELVDIAVAKKTHFIMTQVFPKASSALPIFKNAREELTRLRGPSAKLGFSNTEGFVVGSVAAEAVRVASSKGASVGKASLLDALRTLNVNLGGYEVHFSADSRQGSHFVETVFINEAGRVIG